MKKRHYHAYQEHENEHSQMLNKLREIGSKINDGLWNQNEMQDFVAEWGRHIIHSDMAFNAYRQQQQGL